jgi:RHS repeat-associated protein
VEYTPFGEVVNEYNSDWSNGQVPDFKFNGKELDEESGMYYFEARYQSPPVFISRDPLFEKYPTLSPYSYCANNPVKYIDPTGETIWIADENGTSYKYENGKLFNKDGSEYTEKLSGFLQTTKEALDKLHTTTEGKKMIDNLQSNQNNNFTIVKSNESRYRDNSTEYDAAGNLVKVDGTISWNTEGTMVSIADYPFHEKSPITDLGHELSHAFDANNNQRNDMDYDGLPAYEWLASYRENLIRKELGLSCRKYYKALHNAGTNEYDSGTGPKLIQQKKPYLPSALR